MLQVVSSRDLLAKTCFHFQLCFQVLCSLTPQVLLKTSIASLLASSITKGATILTHRYLEELLYLFPTFS